MRISPNSIIIIFLLLIASINSLYGQNKFAYINSQELISKMDEAKNADEELKNLQDELDNLYQEYLTEYNIKAQDYQKGVNNMSDILRESLLSDLESLEERIKAFQNEAQVQIDKKKDELYQPILEKVSNLMVLLAEKHAYTYIFDTSSGSLIYAPPGDNIIDMAVELLNEQSSE